MVKKVGVLALQGAFREHISMLRSLGTGATEIRYPEQLEDIKGLIIPGGESTAIAKLIDKHGFKQPLIDFYLDGKGIYGTCAGVILLAKEVEGGEPVLSLMDIKVVRNAYGRQVDSFEAPLKIDGLNGQPFNGVFIRAPWIDSAGKAKIIGTLNGKGVIAAQGKLLATTFHPELTGDPRIHQMFLNILQSK